MKRLLALSAITSLLVAGCGGEPTTEKPPAGPPSSQTASEQRLGTFAPGAAIAPKRTGPVIASLRVGTGSGLAQGAVATWREVDCSKRTCVTVRDGQWSKARDMTSTLSITTAGVSRLYRSRSTVFDYVARQATDAQCWIQESTVTVPPTSTEVPAFWLRSPRNAPTRILIDPAGITVSRLPAKAGFVAVLARSDGSTVHMRFDGSRRMTDLVIAVEGRLSFDVTFAYGQPLPQYGLCPTTTQ